MPDFESSPLPPPSDISSDYVPQFSTVQYIPPPGTEPWARCSNLLTDRFFIANQQKICPGCAQLAAAGESKADHAAFVRGLLFGIGGAIVGLILYAAVAIVTHITIGYLALAVGWLVGKTMLLGSANRGGRHYQIAAALLTYAAISLASIPEILWSIYSRHISIADWSSVMRQLLVYGIASPFLRFGRNPAWAVVGLIVLFVGIRIAWQMTRAKSVSIAGPYNVSAS